MDSHYTCSASDLPHLPTSWFFHKDQLFWDGKLHRPKGLDDWNMNIKKVKQNQYKVDVDVIKRISNECKSGQNIKRSGPNVFPG